MTANVSVIIPTWNRAATIKAAVVSSLNQTCPPLEVLVCDDGSSDCTQKIVGSLNDPRVRWLAGHRGGCPAIPRNRGVKQSKGEWLAFLDSDDQWLPTKLEEQLKLASKLCCKAVCTNARRIVPGNESAGNLLSYSGELLTFDDLLEDNQVVCSSAVVHRSLFEVIYGFPEEKQLTALEDYALWLRAATQTNFAFVEKPLTVYYDDPASSLRGVSHASVWTQRELVFGDLLKWLSKQTMNDTLRVCLREAREQHKHARRQTRRGRPLNLLMRLRSIFSDEDFTHS